MQKSILSKESTELVEKCSGLINNYLKLKYGEMELKIIETANANGISLINTAEIKKRFRIEQTQGSRERRLIFDNNIIHTWNPVEDLKLNVR